MAIHHRSVRVHCGHRFPEVDADLVHGHGRHLLPTAHGYDDLVHLKLVRALRRQTKHRHGNTD